METLGARQAHAPPDRAPIHHGASVPSDVMTVMPVKMPDRREIRTQNSSWIVKCDALPPLNITQIKPACQPGQQQVFPKCFNRRLKKQHIKPIHPPQWQQGEKRKPLPPLNIVQIKPEHRPLKQQKGNKLPDILPPLNSKPRATHKIEAKHQGFGVFPNINKKEQPKIIPVQQKRCPGQRPVAPDFNKKKEIRQELANVKSEANQFPLTPKDVLNSYGKNMTKNERDEILYYSEIWYLGHITKKAVRFLTDSQNPQSDNKANLRYDHIAYRYEVLEMLGSGSYGQVYKCLDHKTSEKVAIKVISSNSAMIGEAKMLDFLRMKDKNSSCNIIHMKEYFYFRTQLCIVFDLVGQNLYNLLKKNKFKGLSLGQVRNIAQELLKCLRLLEKEKIIHGDLKPENIVLSPDKPSGIKVIDFGFSCFEHQQEYPCIGTQYYCAPEVMVRKRYTTAIDMWSLACILCELYTGEPLFYGEDETYQMSCMMEVLGKPPSDFVSSRRELFFDCKGRPIKTEDHDGRQRVPGSQDLASVLNTDNELFLDFIKRCLTWDPKMRLMAKEALQHKWIQQGRH
ncbi:dual specificity tyrosine-phosphorylation-regulated kinase 4-like [Trichomycterus rosablanca]|uniref:dual specificity tyrosine-phosphorylation-regulated kinase 4-like n=1 Tax=Trichomycterus rosablanca TaxID=2290929 RepID=UPI002F35DA3A